MKHPQQPVTKIAQTLPYTPHPTGSQVAKACFPAAWQGE